MCCDLVRLVVENNPGGIAVWKELKRVKDVQRWQTLVATALSAGVSAILWVVLISGADWLLR